jgi:AraC-like DNA-binding protein
MGADLKYTKILFAGTEELNATFPEELNAEIQKLANLELRELFSEIQIILPDILIIGQDHSPMVSLALINNVRTNAATAHLPIIVISNSSDYELEFLNAGVDNYLVAPLSQDILRAKIKSIAENYRRLLSYCQKQTVLKPQGVTVINHDQLFLERATDIVEGNLNNTAFNVQSLVSMMHMSQSVLYRRIKTLTGRSLVDFIKTIRLKKAAQLLHQPQARVSEVAYMVGIEDPKNFRTSFQRQYCISPSRYAKLHR